MKLACHYDVNYSMVYAIAAFHDLGLKENRERHHILSAEMIRTDERLKEWFNEEEIQKLSKIVNDVTGGIKGKGFMFAMPVSYVEGLE